MKRRALFLLCCSLFTQGFTDRESQVNLSVGFRNEKIRRTMVDWIPFTTEQIITKSDGTESILKKLDDIKDFFSKATSIKQNGNVNLMKPDGQFWYAVRKEALEFYVDRFPDLKNLDKNAIDDYLNGIDNLPKQIDDGSTPDPIDSDDIMPMREWFEMWGIDLNPPKKQEVATEKVEETEYRKSEYERELSKLKYLRFALDWRTLLEGMENSWLFEGGLHLDAPLGKGVVKRRAPWIKEGGEFSEEKLKAKMRWGGYLGTGYAFLLGETENRFILHGGLCMRHQDRDYELEESLSNTKGQNYGSWEWGPYVGCGLEFRGEKVSLCLDGRALLLRQKLPEDYSDSTMTKRGAEVKADLLVPCGEESSFSVGGGFSFDRVKGKKQVKEDTFRRKESGWVFRLGWEKGF